MLKKFLDYINNQIGCGYVLGAQGQIMTEEFINKHEKDAYNRKRAMKWVGKVAYDCSGLIVNFLLANKLIPQDNNANGLYFNHCIDINKNDLKAGDLVFRKYLMKNRMYHVGVYMGNGYVVHAKGRDVGVVKEKISYTYWNRYGRLKMFINEPVPVDIPKLEKNLKKGSKGEQVKLVQQRLNSFAYYNAKIDGIFGSKTDAAVRKFQKDNRLKVDGIVGPLTWAALFK